MAALINLSLIKRERNTDSKGYIQALLKTMGVYPHGAVSLLLSSDRNTFKWRFQTASCSICHPSVQFQY